MNEIYFKIEGDVVIKYIPMSVMLGEDIYKAEVVMTKDIFQECYKKWVEPQKSGEENETWIGNKHECRTCKYCNVEELICRPNSKDCHSEYKLDAEDLDKPERCDFYEKRESEE